MERALLEQQARADQATAALQAMQQEQQQSAACAEQAQCRTAAPQTAGTSASAVVHTRPLCTAVNLMWRHSQLFPFQVVRSDIYQDRPKVQASEAPKPPIDDSDEAIEAALRRARGGALCTWCSRRQAKQKVHGLLLSRHVAGARKTCSAERFVDAVNSASPCAPLTRRRRAFPVGTWNRSCIAIVW